MKPSSQVSSPFFQLLWTGNWHVSYNGDKDQPLTSTGNCSYWKYSQPIWDWYVHTYITYRMGWRILSVCLAIQTHMYVRMYIWDAYTVYITALRILLREYVTVCTLLCMYVPTYVYTCVHMYVYCRIIGTTCTCTHTHTACICMHCHWCSSLPSLTSPQHGTFGRTLWLALLQRCRGRWFGSLCPQQGVGQTLSRHHWLPWTCSSPHTSCSNRDRPKQWHRYV